jgi:hypothetical protein
MMHLPWQLVASSILRIPASYSIFYFVFAVILYYIDEWFLRNEVFN